MNKKSVLFIIIATVLVVGFTAWWVAAMTMSPNDVAVQQETTDTQQSTEPTATDPEAPVGVTIVFTDDGFEKDSYTVKAGETVKVVNNSSVNVQFSSDEHPTHTDNPELNMEDLAPGESGTITPQKAGSWGIHDHDHSEFTTTLTVTD